MTPRCHNRATYSLAWRRAGTVPPPCPPCWSPDGPTRTDSAPGWNANRQGAGTLAADWAAWCATAPDSALLELTRRALVVADRYVRDAADDDDEPPECDICGGEHYTLNCPQPDD